MEKTSRTRLVTGLVLLLVFGAGVLLGVAVDRSLAAPVEEVERTGGRADDDERRRRGPMYEQVDPSEEQKILIDSIVRDHREAMKALHAEFRAAYNPRYDALITQTREAIKSALTPEQAQAYDSLVADFERRRSERSPDGDRE